MDKATSFLDKKVDINFCDPTTLHDRVLLVQGKKFYVISMYLAMHSEYFYGLFNTTFKEKDQPEIELKGVDANAFELFLKMLHQQETEFDCRFPFNQVADSGENLANLIRLSNMFLSPIIWQKCIKLLEHRRTWSNSQMDELFELLSLPGSYGLRPFVERRCIEEFRYDTRLSKFLKIVEEYKFDRLMECIFCEISSKISYPCRDILELVLKNTEFAKFKDVFEERYSNSKIDDAAALLYVIIMLSKYDLPELQAYVNYYFFVKQPSAEVIQQLMNWIQNLSTEREESFKKMIHISAKYLETSPHTFTDVQGIGNMLLEFSYLFRHDYSQEALEQAHELVKSFLYNFNMSDVKEFFDAKWALTFEIPMFFKNIKFVLEQNLTQSKKAMENWFKDGHKDIITRRVSLVRHMHASKKVDKFVRDSLKKNPNGKALLKQIGS